MPDGDGIDQLQARMARSRRVVPTPRRPADVTPAPSPATDEVVTSLPVVDPASVVVPPSPAPPVGMAPTVLAADEPQANLAVRVRRSLDLRLDDLLHELRHKGVRASKAELVEMLLWELPPTVTGGLEERIVQFRHHAARR